MRILMLITIGFATACAMGIYLPVQVAYLLASLILLGVSGVLFVVFRRVRWVRIISVLLLGVSLGLGWFHQYNSRVVAPAQRRSGMVREAVLTATDYSYRSTYGYGCDGFVVINDREYKLRIYFDDEVSLKPGDRIYGEFRFRYTSAKDGEIISHYQGKGIFLVADQQGEIRVVSQEKMPLRYLPEMIALRIRLILEESFPEDVYPFVKALLLGDSSDLRYDVDTDLRISGIRHIIAVSGLHVTILYALIEKLTAKKRLLTFLIGAPVLLLFAGVAGFTPSVSRSCLMVGLMMVSRLFHREYDSPTSLSFACLVMLLANPMILSSVSFQLSVSCVAGILLFQKPIRDWIYGKLAKGKKDKTRWKNMLSGSVAVTLSAMTVTTPLSAYYFGAVSIVGVITNLLVLWVVTLVFNGVIITSLMYLLWPAAAAAAGWLIAWPIRYILLVAKILSRVPLAAVYTSSVYIVLWLVFCYILLLVFLLSRKRSAVALFCSACIGLCVAVLLSWAEPLADDCRVTVLDVGQGQSILVQTEGKTFLVDCGGDDSEAVADTVIQKLYSQGIRRLDAVFLTHSDNDHSGALANILSRLEVPLLFLPATESEFTAPEKVSDVIWVDRETKLSFGDCTITIYPPVFTVDRNENSLCILFDTENCDILVTGDRSGKGERLLLKQFALPKVDLLVAGHHGAISSTSEELLRAVRPETVIISVGANNNYGHPSDALLERLAVFGCGVYRTDLQGTVVYRR